MIFEANLNGISKFVLIAIHFRPFATQVIRSFVRRVFTTRKIVGFGEIGDKYILTTSRRNKLQLLLNDHGKAMLI